jgi:peroxiredoxin
MSAGLRASLALSAAALLTSSCGGTPSAPLGGREALPKDVPPGAVFGPEDRTAPKAPDFDVRLLDGTKVKASEVWAERPVVIIFFASWCRVCAAQQGALSDLARKKQDLVAFIGVATQDAKEPVLAYLREHDVPYAVAIDEGGLIWRSYAVEEPPLVAVVSKGGRLIKGWPGGTTRAKLDKVLTRLARYAGS